MLDEFRWPGERSPDLRDGLTTVDVIDALYAPAGQRMENRIPVSHPTLLFVCAPIPDLRLIVVVCVRAPEVRVWTIASARLAGPDERAMWRKVTS